MQESHKRWVKLVSVNFTPLSKGAGLYLDKSCLVLVFSKLKKMTNCKDKKLTHPTRKNSVHTTLEAVEWLGEEKNRICLLISMGDANKSDPSFRHRLTGNKRDATRNHDEDPAVSAHLIIDFSENGRSEARCYGYLEEMPGMTPSHLTAFLRFILGQCGVSYSFEKADQTIGSCKISIDVKIVAKKELKEVYEETDLKSIVFERKEDSNLLDDQHYTEPAKGRLEFKFVDKPPTFDKLWTWVSKFRDKVEDQQGHYDKVKVNYKLERAGSFVVGSEAKRQDALGVLLAKCTLVTLDAKIAQCQEILHSELVDKMNALLSEDI